MKLIRDLKIVLKAVFEGHLEAAIPNVVTSLDRLSHMGWMTHGTNQALFCTCHIDLCPGVFYHCMSRKKPSQLCLISLLSWQPPHLPAAPPCGSVSRWRESMIPFWVALHSPHASVFRHWRIWQMQVGGQVQPSIFPVFETFCVSLKPSASPLVVFNPFQESMASFMRNVNRTPVTQKHWHKWTHRDERGCSQ